MLKFYIFVNENVKSFAYSSSVLIKIFGFLILQLRTRVVNIFRRKGNNIMKSNYRGSFF